MQQRYEDIHDRQTIEECLRVERFMDRSLAKIANDDLKRSEKIMAIYAARDIAVFYTAGERAKQKSTHLEKWIERDRKEQERLDATIPQKNVPCLKCSAVLSFDLKTSWSTGDQERVLLFYSCPNKCLPKRAFFDDGEEYHSEPILCCRCEGSTKLTSERKGSLITSIWTCQECGYKDIDEYDTNKPIIKDPPINEELRQKYCLDADRMREYLDSVQNLKDIEGFMNRIKSEEEDTETNNRMDTLKRLRVIDLQILLEERLVSIGMTKIELSSPVHDRGFRLKISMLDADSARGDYDSKRLVSKTLKEALITTNWRLVSSSLESTLGALSGELIGYTTDDDIRKLIERENKVNKS